MPESDNHSYNVPNEGDPNWDVPLNENFRDFDTDIELRDVASNRSTYTPKDGARFLATDTGVVSLGDGSSWLPSLAVWRFIAPATSGGAGNLVAGHPSNSVASGVSGATIAGGGFDDGTDVWPNEVTADYGTIGGGRLNSAGGGATVGGGRGNAASGSRAAVGGGINNLATSTQATVAGGNGNEASGGVSTVAGGSNNEATADFAAVGGGLSNVASGANATIGGGVTNVASGANATIGGGDGNTADGLNATVGGGSANSATVENSTVGGGTDNTASGSNATVAGGETNAATVRASVGGGSGNDASGFVSTIGGGINNTTSATHATVGGGVNNTASGQAATVPGGSGNRATGDGSLATGIRAIAENERSFVWNDATFQHDVDGDGTVDGFSSAQAVDGESVTGADTFNVNATGGVRFVTGGSSVTYIPSGSTGWTTTSSRAAKTNVQPVDPRQVLAGVESLEVATWEYRDGDGTGAGTMHVGPMAEDFHDAFDVGDSDAHINAINADGVALAAIKGLAEMLDERDERIEALSDRLDALEAENGTSGDATCERAENSTDQETN